MAAWGPHACRGGVCSLLAPQPAAEAPAPGVGALLGYGKGAPVVFLHPALADASGAVSFPSERALRRRGVELEVEVIDQATGQRWQSAAVAWGSAAFCRATLEARAEGVGPFTRRVTGRWLHRKEVRELVCERPWSPPAWPNRRPGLCARCGFRVAKGSGFHEQTRKLGRGGRGFLVCSECFLHEHPWAGREERELRGAEGLREPPTRKVEGEGVEVKATGKVAGSSWKKREQAEGRKRRRRERIYGAELAGELEEGERDRLRIHDDFAANQDLATRYREGGRPDLARKVSVCRRSFKVFECGGCGAEETGAVTHACHERLCAHCSRVRTEEQIAKTREVILARGLSEGDLAMLTLTVKNVPGLVRETWQELGRRFNLFRALLAGLLGEEVLPGGLRASEVTHGEGRGFNVHLHAVVELPEAIPQELLADAWLMVTAGAGYVVDVRRVYERAGASALEAGLRETIKDGHEGAVKATETVELAAGELAARYVTKVLDVSDPDALVEIRESLHGVRVVEKFGAWRKVKAEEPEEEPRDDSDLDHEGEDSPCSACGGSMVYQGTRLFSIHEAPDALVRTRRAQRLARAGPG